MRNIKRSWTANLGAEVRGQYVRLSLAVLTLLVVSIGTSARASAQETLCDNSYEDCRAPILQLIRNENVKVSMSRSGS